MKKNNTNITKQNRLEKNRTEQNITEQNGIEHNKKRSIEYNRT